MIIKRDIENFVKYCASKFPVLTITGPRQSGKTTLAKNLFKNSKYVTLEDPDTLEVALYDPRGFLNSLGSGPIILDEVQNCPLLFSYIQAIVDSKKESCQFILTGSQNFLMLEKVSQSLAGRAAIINLLPFSFNEISQYKEHGKDKEKYREIDQVIYSGGYPPIYDKEINPSVWLSSYIMTYLERDVRKILNISDLAKFQVFMRICAGRIGQLINFSSLATEIGVTYHTIKSWLSILEASYIVYLHKPHFKNFSKRLVKQPKLYFYDTAVACALLGIKDPSQIFDHYMRGSLFENFVIIELIKARFNQGQDNNIYFWRDNHGHEVDVIIDNGSKLTAVEIKSSQTFSPDLLRSLKYWKELTSETNVHLVYQGDKSFILQNDRIISWKDIIQLMKE